MKKLKIFAVLMLSVILCFVCVTNSTFSWFARPQTQRAEKFGWDINYDISQGSGISMKTYSGTLDANGVMNYSNETASFSASGLGAGDAKYFKTDIINTGAAQSVSLFLTSAAKVGTSGMFFLGVNGPTRTYKQYLDPILSGEVNPKGVKTATNKMRIYFQDNNCWYNNDNIASDRKTYVNLIASDRDYHEMKLVGNNSSPYNNRTWYYDVPTNQSNLFFSMQDFNQNYQRTADFNPVNDGISQSQSKVYICSKDTNGYNQRLTTLSDDIQGANFVNKYSSIVLNAGKTFDASLQSGVDYYAGTIKYYSGNTEVFTVNENTGEITGVSAGTTKLYTKITGASYGDTWQEETEVTVYPAAVSVDTINKDIPIVTNLKIDPAVDSSNPTIVSVYWYIKNDSSSDPLTYTIEDIYLTL